MTALRRLLSVAGLPLLGREAPDGAPVSGHWADQIEVEHRTGHDDPELPVVGVRFRAVQRYYLFASCEGFAIRSLQTDAGADALLLR